MEVMENSLDQFEDSGFLCPTVKDNLDQGIILDFPQDSVPPLTLSAVKVIKGNEP